ncbi:carboxypeptidase-like regulatory domain-containing protein [Flavicella sp.]|uniref:carboxypeptidase-like regulatory domain-containing protein n=1 Tax=Flavicella sp. TaxID=2957742 RepID=UPI00301A9776
MSSLIKHSSLAKKIFALSALTVFLSCFTFCFSQTRTVIEGAVLDSLYNSVLPYVHVLILKNNRGTITNEKGSYSIDLSDLAPTDTVSFQFLGYKTKTITINNLIKLPRVFLSENVMSIDEVIITNRNLDAEHIVKNVLKNKSANYQTNFHKDRIFVRERYITDVNKIELDYKKSTIKELNEDIIRDFENKTPKNSTSYFDFLADFYIDAKRSELKLDPIKAVELTSKDLAGLENYKPLFDKLFANTGEEEYWKIKSGIFGQKIDLPKDSIRKQKSSENRPLKYYKYLIEDKINYITFEDKDLWEFLHKTNRYNFEFEGSTSTNGESVYIISFTPKNKGMFEGKLYVSTDTYALLKASYKYSEGKTGKKFNFLGVGYEEIDFHGTIYFEKVADIYRLKYFSFNKKYNLRIKRKIALQKKKNRFLFDKKLVELKIGLNLDLQVQEAIEYFAIKTKKLTEEQFENYKEKKTFNIINIDQFDKNLWKGYDIIEPTKQLKNYKKLE